jgi:hypothetical protein
MKELVEHITLLGIGIGLLTILIIPIIITWIVTLKGGEFESIGATFIGMAILGVIAFTFITSGNVVTNNYESNKVPLTSLVNKNEEVHRGSIHGSIFLLIGDIHGADSTVHEACYYYYTVEQQGIKLNKKNPLKDHIFIKEDVPDNENAYVEYLNIIKSEKNTIFCTYDSKVKRTRDIILHIPKGTVKREWDVDINKYLN